MLLCLLATHARGALPLVGAAWGVTARKANHNASNATVVTAGKMVCVSVKYRRPNRWTDQIWHAYADVPGDGSYLNKLTSPRSGNFRGSKDQKSGKCHELSRQSIHFFNPSHPGGFRGGWGQNFKSPVNFMNCRENRLKKIPPPPPPKGVAVGILGGQKIKSPGNVMNCREK